jgi:transcriptional regulator with XRE-family HTH domain
MKTEHAEDPIERLSTDEALGESFAIVDLVRQAGDMLARMRERAGLSQTELAERLGMTPGRVWQLESGTLRHAPSLKNVARWARVCGESVHLQASGESQDQAVSSDPGDVVQAEIDQVAESLRARIVRAVQGAAAPELRAEGFGHVKVEVSTVRQSTDHLDIMMTVDADTKP